MPQLPTKKLVLFTSLLGRQPHMSDLWMLKKMHLIEVTFFYYPKFMIRSDYSVLN